jgi:hypothetical protein
MLVVAYSQMPEGEARRVPGPAVGRSAGGSLSCGFTAPKSIAPARGVRESLPSAGEDSLDWPAKVRVSRLSWSFAQLRLQTFGSPRQERLSPFGVNRVSPEPSRAEVGPGATVNGTPRIPSSTWKLDIGDGWGHRAGCRASAGRNVGGT